MTQVVDSADDVLGVSVDGGVDLLQLLHVAVS